MIYEIWAEKALAQSDAEMLHSNFTVLMILEVSNLWEDCTSVICESPDRRFIWPTFPVVLHHFGLLDNLVDILLPTQTQENKATTAECSWKDNKLCITLNDVSNRSFFPSAHIKSMSTLKSHYWLNICGPTPVEGFRVFTSAMQFIPLPGGGADSSPLSQLSSCSFKYLKLKARVPQMSLELI